jgi:hypothetical protein
MPAKLIYRWNIGPYRMTNSDWHVEPGSLPTTNSLVAAGKGVYNS